ncbi:hypothetical protein BBW65_05015 [Helicobacter enhydrae]|uniref:Uncharacterized protein n=1 Tax=Helicobacter enhydrae TaxID=222136 RepID=A0A1B1U5Y0_9HELI|nr:hypothetical protein BBW65_05015 [Helicobacter enhydrae]
MWVTHKKRAGVWGILRGIRGVPRNKPPCPPYRKKQSGIWKPRSVLWQKQSQERELICRISKFYFWFAWQKDGFGMILESLGFS